jgi:hypothetical protein
MRNLPVSRLQSLSRIAPLSFRPMPERRVRAGTEKYSAHNTRLSMSIIRAETLLVRGRCAPPVGLLRLIKTWRAGDPKMHRS